CGTRSAPIRAVAIALALSAVACASAQRGPLVSGAPRAVPVATVHEFGEMPPGGRVEHRFVIENRGDRLLEIEPVESSCGCRASLAAADVVAPGESAGITVQLEAEDD